MLSPNMMSGSVRAQVVSYRHQDPGNAVAEIRQDKHSITEKMKEDIVWRGRAGQGR